MTLVFYKREHNFSMTLVFYSKWCENGHNTKSKSIVDQQTSRGFWGHLGDYYLAQRALRLLPILAIRTIKVKWPLDSYACPDQIKYKRTELTKNLHAKMFKTGAIFLEKS